MNEQVFKLLLSQLSLETVLFAGTLFAVNKFLLLPKLDAVLEKLKPMYAAIKTRITDVMDAAEQADYWVKSVALELKDMSADGKLTEDEVATILGTLPVIKDILAKVIKEDDDETA